MVWYGPSPNDRSGVGRSSDKRDHQIGHFLKTPDPSGQRPLDACTQLHHLNTQGEASLLAHHTDGSKYEEAEMVPVPSLD